ncbi:LysR family transcriptional regulator [Paramagnetospirillum kuznetsovii]|uniref:LysR family transcriptional regulator n=1 Tax=Paramagnetospirillum kuznetsovii TaxID=2053833 RepID=A0A364NZA5_9PROT|nr:LysR substrate-binding domain-containing protein [Paramagnetospirillum kuznetsovii]RAU22411.1 LysR family transcriptional regulator [Paramagnetospirillum kuznetsovii]
MTHSLDIDGLRAFVAVVETMSFSKAATRVGRTQSGVSLQLARLERVLGKALLLRRQGRVDGLTEDGRTLLPFARRMVDLNESAWRAMTASAVTGRVRLGVPADFLDMDFPDLLRRFQAAHGGVELDVVSDVSDVLRAKLRDGGLDVAFFKREAATGEGDAVARQQLRWVGNRAASPDLDQPIPLVLFPESCAYRRAALTALEDAGLRWRIAFTSPSAEGVRAAIVAGLGLGVLPKTCLDGDVMDVGGSALPPLSDVEVAVAFAPTAGPAARFLSEHISRGLGL